MTGRVEARLQSEGIELPRLMGLQASYIPVVELPGILHIAPQMPLVAGKLVWHGRVGHECNIDQAAEASALCTRLILSVARVQLGDLDRIRQVVRLGLFVRCSDGFGEFDGVAAGVIGVMSRAFEGFSVGTLTILGVPALPYGVPVALEAILDIS
jgi:enamine deaminase RidA (YjgF/YER057c/UK114 family)